MARNCSTLSARLPCRSDGDHAQGLRRRVRCHVVEEHSRRFNFAYPSAEIAVMGPEQAINIVFRNELANAKDACRAQAAATTIENFRESIQGASSAI